MATANVLIIGGGFAGLAAARTLRRHGGRGVRLRLLDRHDHSAFLPMLPDLISGRVAARHIAYPIGRFCRRRRVEFVRDEVEHLDVARPAAHGRRGTYEADFIILATGCETNYLGKADLPARTLGLKSIAEGVAIRRRAEAALRRAPGAATPVFLVVGGGYTGVEAASHLAALCRAVTHLSYARLWRAARVVVVERGGEILGNVSPQVRQWAAGLVRGFGVTVRTESTVASLSAEGQARLSDGTVLQCAAVVWAVGVTPGEPAAGLEGPRRRGGRLAVDAHLRVPGAERVFAAGDVAGAVRPGGGEEPLRMGVQFSLAAGRHAGQNVLAAIRGRRLRALDPWDPGYVIPLAPGRAAGRISGVELVGRVPYLMHYGLCVARSWGLVNRLGVLGDVLTRRAGSSAAVHAAACHGPVPEATIMSSRGAE